MFKANADSRFCADNRQTWIVYKIKYEGQSDVLDNNVFCGLISLLYVDALIQRLVRVLCDQNGSSANGDIQKKNKNKHYGDDDVNVNWNEI